MGNVNIDDVRGYFMELVTPNFDEFYRDYQSQASAGSEHLVMVYRRLVNLALTLNHQTDKTKSKFGYDSPVSFIKAIQDKYPEEGEAIDRVRCFANNIKHEAKLDQTAGYNGLSPEGEPIAGAELLPEWKAVKKSGETFEVCSSVIMAYVFWGKYFASERSIEQAT